jgi:hypothetical protein
VCSEQRQKTPLLLLGEWQRTMEKNAIVAACAFSTDAEMGGRT